MTARESNPWNLLFSSQIGQLKDRAPIKCFYSPSLTIKWHYTCYINLNQIQWFLKHYKYDWLMTASGIKKERRRIELVSHSDELSFALVNFWSHHMRASSHDESWKPSLCRPHWVESLFGIKFTYSKWCVLRPGYSLVRFAR